MGLVAYFVANSTLFVTCVLFVFITCFLLLFVFFNRKTFYSKKIFRTYKYQNSNIMKIERPDIIPDRFYTQLWKLLFFWKSMSKPCWNGLAILHQVSPDTTQKKIICYASRAVIYWSCGKVRNINSLIFSPATSCYALLCPVMLCYVLLCSVMSWIS